MLAARSYYFEEKFLSDDTGPSVVCLKQYKPSVVDEVLTYLYSGDCSTLASGRSGVRKKITPNTDDVDKDDTGISEGLSEMSLGATNDKSTSSSLRNVQISDKEDEEKEQAMITKSRLLLDAAVRLQIPMLQAEMERHVYHHDNVYPMPISWRSEEL